MYPKPIQQLIEVFQKFPGIGPKQAARFAFFVLRERETLVTALAQALDGVRTISFCGQCFRTTDGASDRCALCRDKRRDSALVAVVEKESDLATIEDTGEYRGLYHVLGGVVSPLDANSPARLHLKELHARISSLLENGGRAEVILATSSTAEGDMTALYIERILSPLKTVSAGFAISRLGRGLSIGSEIEYADPSTLKNALANRK